MYAGAESAFWVSSSVSGLEAMDSILDNLVVLNGKMRTALINGPLVSFETMVPHPPRPPPRPPSEENYSDLVDNTFHLTSVAVRLPVGQYNIRQYNIFTVYNSGQYNIFTALRS